MIRRLLFIAALLTAPGPVLADDNGPVPVRTFSGERDNRQWLTLLADGSIAVAQDAKTIIDKDGAEYVFTMHYTHQQTYNPQTKSVISVCTSSSLSVTARGRPWARHGLSGCPGMPLVSITRGRVFALLSGSGLFGNSSLFLLPSGGATSASGVPGAVALAAAENAYYAAHLAGWNDTLEIYALSPELAIVKVHRLGRNAKEVRLVVDDAGRPHVTYYDTAKKVLMYARLEGESFALYELDGPDSGFEHNLDVDGRDVIVAAYFIRNPYNKGIALYRIPVNAGDVRSSLGRRVFLRKKEENVGWAPVISSNGRDAALAVYNRTRNTTEIYRIAKNSIDSANDHRPAWMLPWMEQSKSLDLYLSIGATSAQWRTKVSTDFSDGAIASGRYRIDPFFLQEIGIGGEAGGVSFAFNYLVNALDGSTEGPPAAEEAYEFFSGMIGIDDLIGRDKTLEAHTRTGKLQGQYANGGSITNFTTRYYDVDVDVFNKRGYFFWGLGYRKFSTPQPVVVTQNNVVLQQYVTNADFRTYSVLIGVSTLNYLRRYETSYSGFYIDGRGHFGIGDVTLDQRPAVPVRQTRPVVFRAAVDTGYLIFRRSPGLAGLAWLASLGVTADYTYMNNEEVNQEDVPATDGTVNLDRQDLLMGAFLKAGLAF